MNSLNGGYAMIKYNSTQEELQIAYRSKKPVLCYDENRRAHWAVIEETATESVDEETQEPITIYEYSYRLIDEASGEATLDDIVDSQGNKRFIEGNGTPISKEKWNSSYCKWSLSGTHLMCVFAGSVEATGTISQDDILAEFTLPNYILNKILTVFGVNNLDRKSYTFFTERGTVTYTALNTQKTQNGIRFIFKDPNQSAFSETNYFRIQFDLLIDAE